MIGRPNQYAMLLTSLPAHPTNLFSAHQTSISKIQLENRLALLDARDAENLRCIEELLFWSQVNNASDEFIIKKSNEVVEKIHDAFLKRIIIWRLELRTLLSALRLRHAGVNQPKKHTFPGIGQWRESIETNWDKKDFGIGHRLPWIIPAQQMLERHEAFKLEKLLLNLVWQYYANECSRHYFDFPAVVIYVLRWDVINRWTLYRADEAIKRFDAMVNSSLEGLVLDF